MANVEGFFFSVFNQANILAGVPLNVIRMPYYAGIRGHLYVVFITIITASNVVYAPKRRCRQARNSVCFL